MNRITTWAWLLMLGVSLAACTTEEQRADAYGNFEATEVIVSAEANGKLQELALEEGQVLAAGQRVGFVDSTQLYLKKQQLLAAIIAVRSKTQNLSVQEKVFLEQKRNLVREKERVEKLLADGAATSKQLDDINGQIALVDRQMQATLTQLATANRGINSEVDPLLAQIAQIDDQILRSRIVNPIEGRVLTKYAEAQEVTGFGRPLYKIADTKRMFLRVYLSGSQLTQVKLGQEVRVEVDENAESNRSLTGKVTWISEQAEFTPKTIQTKEERVNLVYAMKVLVANDGSLKIGMPGEVYLN